MVAVIFLLSLCIVTFTATSIFLMRMPFLQVKEVVVIGALGIKDEMLKEKTLAHIGSSNIFFFSKDKIEHALKNEFQGIEDVDIRRAGFSKIKISVRERTPAALICAGFPETGLENEECYLSDAEGYVFTIAGKPYPEGYNRYYVPADKGEITAGLSFINKKRFDELQKFLDGASKAGIYPVGILIGDGGEYEMYVRPDTTVYFDDKTPFENTLSNLTAFWDNARKASSSPVFNYINLRFGNTIYYSK